MLDFFFKGYFFQAVETYACPILDMIIIYCLITLIKVLKSDFTIIRKNKPTEVLFNKFLGWIKKCEK